MRHAPSSIRNKPVLATTGWSKCQYPRLSTCLLALPRRDALARECSSPRSRRELLQWCSGATHGKHEHAQCSACGVRSVNHIYTNHGAFQWPFTPCRSGDKQQKKKKKTHVTATVQSGRLNKPATNWLDQCALIPQTAILMSQTETEHQNVL